MKGKSECHVTNNKYRKGYDQIKWDSGYDAVSVKRSDERVKRLKEKYFKIDE